MLVLILILLLGPCSSDAPEDLFCEGEECGVGGAGGAGGDGVGAGDIGGGGGGADASTVTSASTSSSGAGGDYAGSSSGAGFVGGSATSTAAASSVTGGEPSTSSSGVSSGCSSPGWCPSGICIDGECAPVACTNWVQDADETGPDCGGPCADCGPCALDHLIISEVQTRGDGGTRDELIEIYNPLPREAHVPGLAVHDQYGFVAGAGNITMPPFGRYTFVGTESGLEMDGTISSSGIEDTGRLELLVDDRVVDVVCYCIGTSCDQPATGACASGRAVNHGTHRSDMSMARGISECSDTDNSSVDFRSQASTPGAP